MRIQIQDQDILEIRDLATEELVPQDQWGFYSNIDDVISYIQRALEQQAQVLNIDVMDNNFVPHQIYIDYSTLALDDDMSIVIDEFEILPAD